MRRLFDVMTVDVGVNTAYAFWHGDDLPLVKQFSSVKGQKKIINDYDQTRVLWREFMSAVNALQPKQVVLESVRVYGTTHSMMSATSGDLIKLTIILGGYCALLDRADINYRLITAPKWKGQLTKEATAYHVEKINGQKYKSSHITDAVALGFSLMGRFPYNSEVEKEFV